RPREVPATLRDLLSGRHPAGPSEIEFASVGRNRAVRLVYDGRHGALAGIGRFAIDLWRAMHEVEPDAIAIIQAKHRAGWLGPQEQVLPPPTVSVRSGPFSPSELVILPWLLHRERAQVFHSPHFNIPLVRRIPTVITV